MIDSTLKFQSDGFHDSVGRYGGRLRYPWMCFIMRNSIFLVVFSSLPPGSVLFDWADHGEDKKNFISRVTLYILTLWTERGRMRVTWSVTIRVITELTSTSMKSSQNSTHWICSLCAERRGTHWICRYCLFFRVISWIYANVYVCFCVCVPVWFLGTQRIQVYDPVKSSYLFGFGGRHSFQTDHERLSSIRDRCLSFL